MIKVIIIGATSGIGRKLATLYASKKYFVGITGRRNELLNSLQNKFPKNIVTECFDVTGKENIPPANTHTKIKWIGYSHL